MAFQRRIDSITRQFYDDNVLGAYRKLVKLEKTCTEEEKAKLNEIDEINVIRRDISDVDRLLKMLDDFDSWNLVTEADDIATFYKYDGNNVMIRAEMLLYQDIFPLLALFSEIDLFHTWMTVVETATLVHEFSTFRKVLHYDFNLPWPLAHRDASIQATGIQIPQNKSALLILRSQDGDYLRVPEPPLTNDSTVRVDIMIGAVNIMQKAEGVTQMSLIIESDPKISFIPQWLINYCTKHTIYYFMAQVKEQVYKFKGSQFEQRVAEKPEYYNKIHAKINEARQQSEAAEAGEAESN